MKTKRVDRDHQHGVATAPELCCTFTYNPNSDPAYRLEHLDILTTPLLLPDRAQDEPWFEGEPTLTRKNSAPPGSEEPDLLLLL